MLVSCGFVESCQRLLTITAGTKCIVRPGKVDLQFIVKAFLKKHAGGRSFFIFHCQKFSIFKNKFNESHSKIRKPVKNWMNLSIMKVEAVVSGVMRAVMINCESILPGLTYNI